MLTQGPASDCVVTVNLHLLKKGESLCFVNVATGRLLMTQYVDHTLFHIVSTNWIQDGKGIIVIIILKTILIWEGIAWWNLERLDGGGADVCIKSKYVGYMYENFQLLKSLIKKFFLSFHP